MDKTPLLSLSRIWVQSPVRELRSHKPCGMAKINKKNKYKNVVHYFQRQSQSFHSLWKSYPVHCGLLIMRLNLPAPSEFAFDVWPALINTIQQKWPYGISKLGSQNTLQLPLLPFWNLRSWQEETRLASLKLWPCRGKPSQSNSTRVSRQLNHATRRQQPRGCLRWDQQKNHSAETSPNCWPSKSWKTNMVVFLSLKFWSGLLGRGR